MTRYQILDELLSDKYHCYDTKDMMDICNDRLLYAEYPQVSLRCIQKDIHYLENHPFYAEITRYNVDGKRCLRYAKPNYSIFRKELSEEEKTLLCEVISTIGQFEGLDNFEWLENLRQELSLEQRQKIISFSRNPYLKNSNLLGELFNYISNKVVITLSYQLFNTDEVKQIVLHPYLLKEYNSRWYLFAASDVDGKILNFALDRIVEIQICNKVKYKKCPMDIFERFEDIIGVTYYEDRDVERIVFWVSDASNNYVKTKPIHESQIEYKNEDEENLRTKYPTLTNGTFFSIDCIPNYELIRELCSFGKELVVIEPKSVQDEIFNRLNFQLKEYIDLRT